jgi:GNAT superfamily N-acetyltransferase
MSDDLTIRSLSPAGVDERIAELSDVLIDCVDGGASVSFMSPLTRDRADAFWRGVKARVASGMTELLIAELGGRIAGTVQVVMAEPENQPHRADLAKMLVHRRARRRGLGHALVMAAEDMARAKGRTLLVLDTVTGGAGERLYLRLGWTPVGRVPGYALFPDGRPCDTTIFYKQLAAPGAGGGEQLGNRQVDIG